MAIIQKKIDNKIQSTIDFFLVLSILEGAIAIISLFSITPDPKNAFLFGFSKSRLVLIGICIHCPDFFCYSINK